MKTTPDTGLVHIVFKFMFLEVLLSLFTLTVIAVGVFFLARKFRIPYSVLLVLVGTMLVPLTQIPFFAYIRSFELTPDLLFFVFLPVLIFESAYNMHIRELAENIRSVSLLSVLSLLLSTAFVAGFLYLGLHLIGFEVPFLVTLLFGALISATDPVAVLALFKEYGAPRRLSFIFEGESLFNDGTSLALFLVVLEVCLHGFLGWTSIGEGIFLFTSMIVGGVIFGLMMGFVFSKLLEKVAGNEYVEITLTMLAAHLTFILSEVVSSHLVIGGHELRLSSIIATVMTAMVIGNYGRSKMSHAVERYMESFWGYFAFVANSLVFILMGLLFAGLSIDFRFFLIPIGLTILIVMIGRAVSIYPVIGFLNWTRSEHRIPTSWQHLLSWGSLRGALAVTMVLLIPEDLTIVGWQYDFSVKEFLAALTIGCIYFTLLIKATTMSRIMKGLGIGRLHKREEVQYYQSKSLIYARALEKLSDYQEKKYVTQEVYQKLSDAYRRRYRLACEKSRAYSESVSGRRASEQALCVYAIGIERHFLKILFRYGEVSESVYKRVLNKLAMQLTRVEHGEAQVSISGTEVTEDWFEQIARMARRVLCGKRKNRVEVEEQYMYYRAQEIIARKAQKHFKTFIEQNGYEAFGDKEALEKVLERYHAFEEGAGQKKNEWLAKYEQQLSVIREEFGRKGLHKIEEDVLAELAENEMITPKLAILLQDELREKASRVSE